MSKLFNYAAGIGSVFAGSRAAGKSGGYLPGQYTKSFPNVIKTLNTSTENPEIEFGQVIARDVTGEVPFGRAVLASDEAKDIFGVAVQDVTSQSTLADNIIHHYHLGAQISVLVAGQIAVPVQNGEPAIGGQVYVRVAESSTNTALVVGGIETAAVEGETIAVPGWRFSTKAYFPGNSSAAGTTASALTGAVATIEIVPVVVAAAE